MSRQGNNIVIDLPGVKNRQKADALVGKTAELRFRAVQSADPVLERAAATHHDHGEGRDDHDGQGRDDHAPSRAPRPRPRRTRTPAPRPTRPRRARRPGRRPSTTMPDADRRAVPRPRRRPRPRHARDRPRCDAPARDRHHGTATTADDRARSRRTRASDGKLITPSADRHRRRQAGRPARPQEDRRATCSGPTILTGQQRRHGDAQSSTRRPRRGSSTSTSRTTTSSPRSPPYVGKQVAIELDGVVQSAPTINPGITGQDVTISGNFTRKQAHDLALVLRYGSLPVAVRQTRRPSQTVSPTLGKDQLQRRHRRRPHRPRARRALHDLLLPVARPRRVDRARR